MLEKFNNNENLEEIEIAMWVSDTIAAIILFAVWHTLVIGLGQIHLLPNINISKTQQSTCSPATCLKGGSILVLISRGAELRAPGIPGGPHLFGFYVVKC